MKKLMIIPVLLVTVLIYSTESEAKTINHTGFEFGFFYSNLSPHGMWMEIDGLVVWRPTVIKKGWAPYRLGRWIWTIDGWYWDSYEPFGYIVFHYGRWYYDEFYGWIWIPDYDWAPAWVEWRYDNVYIGWAPLSPYALFSINLGIHYTYDYYVPYNHWHFVGYKHFCNPYVYNYYVAPKYKYRVYNRTKYRNNYGYRNGRIINRGIDIDFVRQKTGQEIRQREILRVKDYKEVEKYRGKDTEVIRTFVASRDELSKTKVNDVRIEKHDRSTLDISKVRLGREEVKEGKVEVKNERENSVGRNYDVKEKNRISEHEISIREKNGPEIKTNKETNMKRKENVNTQRKMEIKDFVPEKKVEKKDVRKPKINTESDRESKRKKEITVNSNSGQKQTRDGTKTRVNTETKKNDNSKRNVTGHKVESKSDPDNTKGKRKR